MQSKTILIAPDKFKGSLTAKRFCEIAHDEISKFDKNIKVITCPLADGGEGTLSCFVDNLGADIIEKEFTDANFQKVRASYAISGNIALIECAETCGLMKTAIKNPSITTTLGVGEQILDAVHNGADKIYLTLGGSATNDAGCGMAVGLGYKFYDNDNNEFVPTGNSLYKIAKIVKPTEQINAEVVALCDVKNVLFGKSGASFVYAEQKGASKEDLAILDDNLRAFNDIAKQYGKDFEYIEGSGAAGGLGAGAMFFVDARLESGIKTIFSFVDIDSKIQNADIVITGEGKIDEQSQYGKVVFSLRNKSNDKQFVAFCGVNNLTNNDFDIIDINNENLSLEENIASTEKHLRAKLQSYLHSLVCK